MGKKEKEGNIATKEKGRKIAINLKMTNRKQRDEFQ